MHLQFIVPKPSLQPYIDSFWIFESNYGVPHTDKRLIAPNAKAKIIIPYQNAISTIDNEQVTYYREGEVFFIGIWDKPVVLSTHASHTGTIGIELTPKGAYKFTHIPMYELTNKIYSFSDLYGKSGKVLEQQIGNTDAPLAKAERIQDFLISCLQHDNYTNLLIEYSVDLLSSSLGLTEISELERKTGYSKRYLDMLFKKHLGISPKTLSTLIRFNKFYKLWANTTDTDFFKDHLYESYYDQSHFIHEFRRYTGYSPARYARVKNEFGKLFYKR